VQRQVEAPAIPRVKITGWFPSPTFHPKKVVLMLHKANHDLLIDHGLGNH
jgi:hypothetical protein